MNVMINDITEDLDTTVQGVQATITLFLLVMAILMIPCSKLTDRWGRKRCFIRQAKKVPGSQIKPTSVTDLVCSPRLDVIDRSLAGTLGTLAERL